MLEVNARTVTCKELQTLGIPMLNLQNIGETRKNERYMQLHAYRVNPNTTGTIIHLPIIVLRLQLYWIKDGPILDVRNASQSSTRTSLVQSPSKLFNGSKMIFVWGIH